MDGGGWMIDLLCGREERRGEEKERRRRRDHAREGETVYGLGTVCNLQSTVRAQQTGYCA
jgi:hypothetical protein